MIRFFVILLGFTMFYSYQASESQAATYYVDSNSKCRKDCGSRAKPFRTTQEARKATQLGDRVTVISKSRSTTSSSSKNSKRVPFGVR